MTPTRPTPTKTQPDWLADARAWERRARHQPSAEARDLCLHFADQCRRMDALDAQIEAQTIDLARLAD